MSCCPGCTCHQTYKHSGWFRAFRQKRLLSFHLVSLYSGPACRLLTMIKWYLLHLRTAPCAFGVHMENSLVSVIMHQSIFPFWTLLMFMQITLILILVQRLKWKCCYSWACSIQWDGGWINFPWDSPARPPTLHVFCMCPVTSKYPSSTAHPANCMKA